LECVPHPCLPELCILGELLEANNTLEVSLPLVLNGSLLPMKQRGNLKRMVLSDTRCLSVERLHQVNPSYHAEAVGQVAVVTRPQLAMPL